MITMGESRISIIVAIWKDKSYAVFAISPCVNCRQFVLDIDERNLDCNVILDVKQVVKLRELLPYHGSWKKQK